MMKLKELLLLTDENIDPEFLHYLRVQGFDVFFRCKRKWFIW
jgi:hypothetical protein